MGRRRQMMQFLKLWVHTESSQEAIRLLGDNLCCVTDLNTRCPGAPLCRSPSPFRLPYKVLRLCVVIFRRPSARNRNTFSFQTLAWVQV